jgi:hypothetical protein
MQFSVFSSAAFNPEQPGVVELEELALFRYFIETVCVDLLGSKIVQ